MTAALSICVPTYNRARHLTALLACLEREIGARRDVVVLVADNASTDETPEVLAAAAARHAWLRVHRQPENTGSLGNLVWLAEHAPDAEHMWLFGDDDVIVPGGLGVVLDLLARERPAWLFLPHRWVDADGRPGHGSPAHGEVRVHPDARSMYLAEHHWLTFLSASILRTSALVAAVRDLPTTNAYAPLLWFFRAGLEGACVIAADHLVHASPEISWADRAHLYQTRDFTSLYDEASTSG